MVDEWDKESRAGAYFEENFVERYIHIKMHQRTLCGIRPINLPANLHFHGVPLNRTIIQITKVGVSIEDKARARMPEIDPCSLRQI